MTRLLSRTQAQPTIDARLMAYFLLRYAGFHWKTIGAIMKRDHSTCITGARSFESLADNEPWLIDLAADIHQQAKTAAGIRQ